MRQPLGRSHALGTMKMALPHWDKRLKLFLASTDRMPWPLQWVRCRNNRVCCVRCSEPMDEWKAEDGVPACEKCKKEVLAVVGNTTNDWSKRYRSNHGMG